MKKLEKYGVRHLDYDEHYSINGGQAEGSYSLGYKVGVFVKSIFKVKIWVGWAS